MAYDLSTYACQFVREVLVAVGDLVERGGEVGGEVGGDALRGGAIRDRALEKRARQPDTEIAVPEGGQRSRQRA
ncbi:hypothetical protein ABZW18_29475 [Streptomyces sp. NPDC004647]|uniref:hypothetical protein n=1 Tax=Streptomyces sp. NPDC004647 TaxID=3154671 RepID=UPI0033BEED59